MSHEALASRHHPHVVGNPRIAHALEFAIELRKVELLTTEIVCKAFEATATSLKIREAHAIWRPGSSSQTSSHHRQRSRALFLHHNRRSFTISSRCWTFRSDQDVINLACLRTLTIYSHHRRIARSPELLQSPDMKKTNAPRGRKGILLTIN
ncbi:hypothetical protein TIFTF001_021684 [Ficus carica]|uniref:Uncharacterized protein n=1 Tax=Ficus carica TaxID=3494 RepID=A0AA88AH76_FICCA|nr:hypothetical protein TIFTF001_021684 [Ficus carica]